MIVLSMAQMTMMNTESKMKLRDVLQEVPMAPLNKPQKFGRAERAAKERFEVRYMGTKGKKVEIARFMTLNAAKKFMKDIKKTGAKALIFVNGRPLKMAKQTTMDFGESRKHV